MAFKDNAGPVTFSILLHVVIAAALVGGFFKFRSQPTPQPAPELAIQATVVDERQVQAEMERLREEELAREREAQERAEQLRREQQAERERLEELQRQREEEERQAQVRLEEQRRKEELERKRQAELEAKRKAEEARRKAEEARKAEAERKRKAEEERLRAEREAELKRRMAAEEKRRAAVESGALARYVAQIQARIQRAWIRPPSAQKGLKCIVNVTQAPGGEVVAVSIGECNGDEVVRRSIEAAVHRASPLPEPSDPSLFERNLRLEFKPDD